MVRDPDRDSHGVLARLRGDAENRLDEPRAPRWAAPIGWLIAAAIVALVIVLLVTANPL